MKYDSILIITYGRSGSTLLQGVLNSIDGVLIRGENYNLCYPMFQGYKAILSSNQHIDHAAPSDAWYGSHFLNPDFYIGMQKNILYKMLMGDQYGNSQITCYGFKEIRYTVNHVGPDFEEYLHFLEELFPNAAFIFNTRNIADTIKSGWWKGRDRNDSTELLKLSEARFFDFLEKYTGNTFHITYEDVISKTDRLKDLFSFLETPFHEEKIDDVLSVRHSFQSN